MAGPERLEEEPGQARRRIWPVVLAAVLVVAGLGALRVFGLGPDPAPVPAPAPTTTAGAPWPNGAGRGTLYVFDLGRPGAGGQVVSVDLASGTVQRVPLDVDAGAVRLTPGGRDVVVWDVDGLGTAHVVEPGQAQAFTVGGVLASGAQFLPGPGPGPDLGIWTSSDGFGSAGDAVWRLVGEDGHVAARVRTTGLVQGDGAGGLFDVTDRGTRHLVADRPAERWPGDVRVVGPDGVESGACSHGTCTDRLLDRASGTETSLTWPTPADLDAEELSPGNRFVASAVLVSEADDDAGVMVRVAVTGDSADHRSLPAPTEGRVMLAWLSDRWLATTTDQGLVLYDAVDDRVVVPDLGLTRPTALAVATS